MTVLDHPSPSRALADSALRWLRSGLPDGIARDARRTLLNAAAAGIGGSMDATAQALLAAGEAAHGPGPSPVIGSRRRLDPIAAAAVTAHSVTQDDFDDAHPPTIIHPGAAALAGVMSEPATARRGGGAVLTAFALACEAQLALGSALSPSLYALGWHATSTCAPVGAALATGLMAGLDAPSLAAALDMACGRLVGLRVAHGTHLKGYQVGRGAAWGVESAHVAGAGGRGPGRLGGPGVLPPVATEEEPAPLRFPSPDDGWELSAVTFKPYPAGIVCSGGIEAALHLSGEVDAADVLRVEVQVHPLVAELAGDADPREEMQARVSLPHGIAAALVDGAAGMAQFSASRLADPTVRSLRRRIQLHPDPDLPRATAVVRVITADGARSHRVEDPRGSATRPLGDEELEAKVHGLVEGDRPGCATALIDTIGHLDERSGADLLAVLTTPRTER